MQPMPWKKLLPGAMIAFMERTKERGSFAGIRVLSLESRRAAEMAKLISNYNGEPVVAPSMREVPLESNSEALAFAGKLIDGGFDMAIFLTGVGTRALARVVQTVYPEEKFVEALRKIPVIARGPKPVAALSELGVPVALTVPEPNTWRDLLMALDEKSSTLPLAGKRVALQEYGASNSELLDGLAERGGIVTRVPVYQWALPEDVGPLRSAIERLSRGEIDIVLFTTSIQVVHLLQVADEVGLKEKVLHALKRTVVASIGPVTSEELREHNISPDFEPSHPKMGFLVNELANQCQTLLETKRAAAGNG
jgi:uroporphyrinogen-III synthase